MIEICKEILEKFPAPQRHSDFQIEKFIIGKEPTHIGRAWQCLREIEARYDSLVNLDLEIENCKDDIALKLIERSDKENETNVKIVVKTIEIKKINRQILVLENNLAKLHKKKICLEEESKKFVSIFNELISKIKYVDFNDEKAQKEYFENKFSNEINLNILLGHPINNELVKSTMCLDDNSKIKTSLVESFTNIQRKMLTNGNKDKQL